MRHNGIQSIDLVTRKLAANGGASVWASLDELNASSSSRSLERPGVRHHSAKLAMARLARTQQQMAPGARASAPNDALAGATPYLRLSLDARRLHAGGEALAAKTTATPRRSATLRHAGAVLAETYRAGRLAGEDGDGYADAVNGADAVLLA